MIGRQERWQEDLFVAGPLSDLIPEDHILKLVDRVLDLSWLRDEVRELYSEHRGRPSIDPEAAARLMLAGYFEGITHDRRLMRTAQVNLAIRWFAGYRLHERLPDHSALSKIRARWGEEKFREIFARSVRQCREAGLVGGEITHHDATLIRADVSWESLVEEHVDEVIAVNAADRLVEGADLTEPKACDEKDDSRDDDGGAPRRRRSRRRRSRGRRAKARKHRAKKAKHKKKKKRSRTDPEATLATSKRGVPMIPCYKQHTAVDDRCGVVVDVHVTTGEVSEGKEFRDQIERVEACTGVKIKAATADMGFAHPSNYAELERRGIEAIIPPQTRRPRAGRIPLEQFKYDQKHCVVRCPMGKVMQRSSRTGNGWVYRAATKECRCCPLRARCVPPSATARTVTIVDDYPALLRARRRWMRDDKRAQRLYNRHRGLVEGAHGEAKTQHGLHRATRRGRWNVAIQSYCTAAVMNLKRLAKWWRDQRRTTPPAASAALHQDGRAARATLCCVGRLRCCVGRVGRCVGLVVRRGAYRWIAAVMRISSRLAHQPA